MRACDVLVIGAGATGIEAALAAQESGARVLVCDKWPAATGAPAGLRVLSDAMILDLVLSDAGEVAGALLVDRDANEVTPLRAKAVVLATGGVRSLFPDAKDWRETGDGLAMAHRAGADLGGLEVEWRGDGPELLGGVETDRDGATGVTGLFAAGEVASTRARGREVGGAAATAMREDVAEFGDYAVMPNVDSPLPRGFADVKMERLRGVMGAHFGSAGVADVDRARVLLHQLKGEADDFARARVDPELLSFKNACAVAVLIANAARE